MTKKPLLISGMLAFLTAGCAVYVHEPRRPAYHCRAPIDTPMGRDHVVCLLPTPQPVHSRCSCAVVLPPGFPQQPPAIGHAVP